MWGRAAGPPSAEVPPQDEDYGCVVFAEVLPFRAFSADRSPRRAISFVAELAHRAAWPKTVPVRSRLFLADFAADAFDGDAGTERDQNVPATVRNPGANQMAVLRRGRDHDVGASARNLPVLMRLAGL